LDALAQFEKNSAFILPIQISPTQSPMIIGVTSSLTRSEASIRSIPPSYYARGFRTIRRRFPMPRIGNRGFRIRTD
jgi:hypothetical protein